MVFEDVENVCPAAVPATGCGKQDAASCHATPPGAANDPLCCFYISRSGPAEARCRSGSSCRFSHAEDDGVRLCSFGATCRNREHARRALRHIQDEVGPALTSKHFLEGEDAFWRKFRDAGELVAGGAPAVGAPAFVGDSPADRDANTLRAQLEPWTTPALRRRLLLMSRLPTLQLSARASDIDGIARGEVGRGLVMHHLLHGYKALHAARRVTGRKVVRLDGIPADRTETERKLLADLERELRSWEKAHTKNRQERPSIKAESYMILRSPLEFGSKDSTKARAAAEKVRQHQRLWDLAQSALQGVLCGVSSASRVDEAEENSIGHPYRLTEEDRRFPQEFTALAVNKNFRGSPHIDKQNVGPFWGLSLGDFDEGTGCICVDSDLDEVTCVNTKNRFGKLDGRYPHWVSDDVAPGRERFSLIFYRTAGAPTPVGKAAFPGDCSPDSDSSSTEAEP